MKVRFILLALLAMAGVSACGPKEAAPVKKDMCIQMYSARSLITPENYPDILKEMAAMGYTAVEAANYNGNEGLLYGDAHEGYIGMQDHGDDVWYRNIRIKIMD